MPDWLLERIFPYTQQTLVSSKTILNMNTTTLKLIAVGVAGALFGFMTARIYFSLPAQHEEKSMNPVEPAEPADPPISSIEQIDTTNPFNNKKFDPILDNKEYVIGFMYKMEALKKSLTKPSVVEKKWRTAFPKTRDLLL
jgi:hypothetical protein